MRIAAIIVCLFAVFLNVGKAIAYNRFWDNVSRGANVGSDIITMKLLFVYIPVLICVLLFASIFLVGKYKKTAMVILVVALLVAFYGTGSSGGMGFDQAEDLNMLMKSNLLFIVITFAFVLLSYIFQQLKVKKLATTAVVKAYSDQQTILHSDPATTVEETKECPQCAEVVKAKAKLCRYCNYSFEESPDDLA
jgi:hypothetical protein